MNMRILKGCALISVVLASIVVRASKEPTEQQVKQSYLSYLIGLGRAGAGYVGSSLGSGYNISANTVNAVGGAVASQAGNALKYASSSVESVTNASRNLGAWATNKTIDMMADKYQAAGAINLAQDLLEGKSTEDVLIGAAVGAAMYFTLMKGYGAVSADMSRDFALLTDSLTELNKAKGFEERAPYVKLVISNLWLVIDDILKMMEAIQKTLTQATKIQLSGAAQSLVDPAYAQIMQNITTGYAAYLHAVLELMGTVVPDMFEYFGSLEKLSTVIKPKE